MSSLNVSILSIHWENLRAFGGRPYTNPISAPPMEGEKHNDFPQSTNLFLQMPNGTGKTTTLHLLRSVCIGSLWTSSDEEDVDLKNMAQLKRIIGDDDDAVSTLTGIFKTRMRINGEVYGFEIRLNHESKADEWWTETPGGRRKGWHPPEEFSRVFKNNPRLIELFIFDGETARKVRKRTDQHLLEKAIRQFGGLSLVYDMVGEPDSTSSYAGGRYETVLERLKSDIGKDIGGRGAKVKNWNNCLNKAIEHEKILEADLSEANEILREADKELVRIDKALKQIEIESGEAIEELKDLGDEIVDLDDQLDEVTGTMLLEFLNPSRVFIDDWESIANFHKEHNDRNLPKDVGAGWLLKLADDAEVCVCGEDLTPKMRDHIRKNTDRYLDGEKKTAVSTMQSAFSTSPTANREPLSAVKALVLDFERKRSEAQTKKETIYNHKTLQDKKEERDILNDQKIQEMGKKLYAEDGIRILTESNLVWLRNEGRASGINADGKPTTTAANIPTIENLAILGKVKQNLLRKIQEAKGDVAVFEGLEQTRDIIGRSLSQLSNEMREQVSDQATKVWRTMPAAAAEGKKLKISIEPNGLAIYRGQSTTGVSGAQIVSACYSITKSIGDLGDVSFPLICDTPFSGFDSGMYSPWYLNITDSFNQVIALINTSEKKILLENIWDESIGESDYRASVRQLEQVAPDGGKQLQYTENREIFNTMKSAMDFVKEVK